MEPDQTSLLRDRYRIIRLLGQGGMGAVHLAHDTALEIQVAVKSNRNPGQSSQEQFLREARLLATLRHPNLPRVIDHFIVDDIQYLVMDYVPGEDLETLLERDGVPPINQVMDWAAQLASALSYLHKQDPPVIHRDIKPANVKITPDGQAMLVDFGLAKASDPTQATAAGATGYSPGYAPPEQYGGSHTGPYSDQYSLAATLYKLLTNQKPMESIKRLLGEGVLTPIKGLNPNIPNNVQQAIEKAMSLQPQERFASTEDFLRALRESNYETTAPLGEKTITPTQPSSATVPSAATVHVQADKPVKKTSRGLIVTCLGIAAAFVLLAAAGTAIWYFAIRQPAETPSAEPSPVLLAGITEVASPTTAPSQTNTQSPTETATQEFTQTLLPTSTTEATFTPAPALLVDERQIAFVSDRADGETFQIWTMQVGQTVTNELIALNTRQVTFNEGNKYEPEWSPDGSKILFSAPGQNSDNLQIWVYDLVSEEVIQVTDMEGTNSNPTWSPDGERIAFANFGRFTDVYAIYFIDSDGGNRIRLSVDYQETDPKWTPDMEWLLYVIHASGHDYFFWRNRAEDYATPQPFDPAAMFGRMGEVDEPALTADGSFLAYTRLDGARKQIWSVEFKSRGARTLLLTPNHTTEYHPSWSPDAQWIAFTSERDGNQEIYLMTSVGLLQSNLTNHPAQDMQPDWQK